MRLKKLIFVGVFLLVGYHAPAQRNVKGYNLLGINGGITSFDIRTDDLITRSKVGFTAGFATRGAFRNNFDLIYGINFISSKIAIEGKDPMDSNPQEIEYTVQGVHINFLGSYNIISKHISLEFGPVFNINGKMKLDSDRLEDYILTGYNSVSAKDIEDISKFDVRLAGGFTAGLENFRLSAQYQYGITNTLGRLNDKELEKDDFKGNSSTLILSAIIYF